MSARTTIRDWRRALLALGVTFAFALAGCGGDSSGEKAEATPAPTAAQEEPTPAPEPAAEAPKGRQVAFRASDGVRLRGRFVPAERSRAPALVLVHQSDGSPASWAPFIDRLHAEGYAALAYGSRGEGELDYRQLARDLTGAVRFLRRRAEVDPKRIGAVGASIGATTVAYAAGGSLRERLAATVGLSPEAIDPRPSDWRPQRLLLAADSTEVPAARLNAEGERGVRVLTYPDLLGHGNELLEDGRVEREVLHWLGDGL